LSEPALLAFLLALASLASRRFCLDAEGAILGDGWGGQELGEGGARDVHGGGGGRGPLFKTRGGKLVVGERVGREREMKKRR
jgi:hypothetical protein